MFILLVITVIFFCNLNTEIKAGVVNESLQEQRWAILDLFDELWETAMVKDLTSGSAKPNIFITFLPSNILGLAEPDRISFSLGVLFHSTETQKFVIAHEMGHVVDNPWNQKKQKINFYERRIREECRANVFAAKLLGNESAVTVLELAEKRARHERKKIFSLLLAPVFLTVDTVNSLRFLGNEFFNPFSRYERLSRVHGPAAKRALLVLSGKRQSCNCK
ncbi:MAG: ImmA/IrrE family metallo-endopeptidase [Candidatus Yanofskybacteria bacterium]|nr:ImmA/IrrE family metallo-endopeptidase [Candidatus Yanofskybacteria bacterium]